MNTARACVLLLALMFAKAPAAAQTAVEQVERERQQAARAESVRVAPAKASGAILVLQADADCELKIDGSPIQTLRRDQSTPVQVRAGEQLIECVSVEFPDVRVRQVKDISGGQKAVLVLELARDVEAASDTLKLNGLTWAKSDNGSEIDWNGAKTYCASKGAGWELPTVAELQGIYDPGGAHAFNWTSPFNGNTFQIKPTSQLFQLTSCCFWSKQDNGSANKAWLVTLHHGKRFLLDVCLTANARALCVRRP